MVLFSPSFGPCLVPFLRSPKGGYYSTSNDLRLANRGRLLLRTPGPVPFGTCICSNVATILSWTCRYFTGLCSSNIPRYFLDFTCLDILCSLADGQRIYIGLSDTDQEGDMRWVDGSPVTYENYYSQEPNNYDGSVQSYNADCVIFNLQWADRLCSLKFPFFCERY